MILRTQPQSWHAGLISYISTFFSTVLYHDLLSMLTGVQIDEVHHISLVLENNYKSKEKQWIGWLKSTSAHVALYTVFCLALYLWLASFLSTLVWTLTYFWRQTKRLLSFWPTFSLCYSPFINYYIWPVGFFFFSWAFLCHLYSNCEMDLCMNCKVCLLNLEIWFCLFWYHSKTSYTLFTHNIV